MLAKLLDMGYEVTAHYHSENEITKELKARHPNVRFLQADFSGKDSFLQFVGQTINEKYDVWVNAAVYYAGADDWKPQLDWDEWQKIRV